MSKPELTKILIAETLKKLAEEMPLDKISIQDIVDACGINRKTFYYHFQGKQKLVCWIFDSDMSKLNDVNKNGELINKIIRYMYSNKDFYVAALTSETQNNLREHLFELCYNECRLEIISMLGTREMAPQDIVLLARYFSNAIIGCLVQWAQEGMKTSPDEYHMDFSPITSECLKFIIDKFIK
ncbi:MAG: TetR/AcrR family transcriptional regulator C-terminal domain-containing protein [Caulobacteraceae bacterium]